MTEQEITDTMSSVMLESGMPMAFIHAWETCGFVITEENAHVWDEEDVALWNDALDEGEVIYGALR